MDIINKKILLVEDEEITALLGMKLLNSAGYTVFHVSSGEAAIDFIKNKIQHIDLILMDIDLGSGLDGTETAKKILLFHNIPILFHSSHTEQEIVSKTENITSYGYVVKNSGITVLNASIKMALKLFKAHEELSQKKMELYASLEDLQTANVQLIEAEEGIQKSEEKFSKAFNSNPAVLFISRTEDGKIFDVNESWTKITGYTKAESIGKTTTELGILEYETREKNKEILLREKIVRDHEITITDKFGNKKYILLSATLMEMEGEFFTLGSGIDITESIHAKKDLAERNQEFENLFHFIPDLFFRVGVDGTIQKFIAGARSELYDPSLSFVGKKIIDSIPGSAGPLLEETIQKSILQKSMMTVEYSILINNQEVYYEAMISPLNDSEVLSIVRNISNRKNEERRNIKNDKFRDFIKEIYKLIIRFIDQKKFFEDVCRLAVEEGGFLFAWVGVLENTKILPFTFFGNEEGFLEYLQPYEIQNDDTNPNPLGKVVFSKEICYCNDIGEDYLNKNYKSLISLSIPIKKELKFIINLFSAEKNCFTENELNLLKEVIEDVSFAFEANVF